jgi:hypothetical protein
MQFWTERMFVVLPQEHALCTEEEIEWEAIRDEHFILRRSGPGPAIHDHLIKRVADLGYRRECSDSTSGAKPQYTSSLLAWE